ncbi:MAG: DUF4342 domain-containing protein [Anaerolineae bacterium]|nr:DUF4342 domain-containing protein [Anaerolineae bacterium]
MAENQTPDPENKSNRTFTEELEVAGDQLVAKVKELIDAGNVRKIVVRNPEGRVYMEVPLTVGVLAGGVMFWFAPVLSALGAIGALLARVRIEVIRTGQEGGVSEANIDTGAMVDDVTQAFSGVAGSVRKTVDNLQHQMQQSKAKSSEADDEEEEITPRPAGSEGAPVPEDDPNVE